MTNELVLPRPNKKQKLFIADRHKHCAFGGARGGGKSVGVDLKASLYVFNYAGIRILIVRSTYKELEMNHIRQLKALYKCGTPQALAKYTDGKKQMVMCNGSTIDFDYCATESDLDHFQGGEWDVIFIDEACNFTEEMLRKITACVRGANGFPKQINYTCNPNGKSGFGYIKRLFIEKRYEKGEDPADYSFIQSLVTDNVALMRSNPDYIKQLEALPEKVRRAWLEGDWNVLEGCYFGEYRATPDINECHKAGITEEQALIEHRWTHIIRPFEPPAHWKRYLSYDWGYGKPFSFGFWVQSDDDVLYRVFELYGCTKTPNEGVKWSNSQQFAKASEILREHPWFKGHTVYAVADPSIWDGSHGISASEEADRCGIHFQKGVNDRIAGWMQVHERLKFDDNGYARMYFFDTCEAIARTMPLMMFDEHKVEDLDTDLEDHACDEVRYMCMMRPIPTRLKADTYIPISDPLDMFTPKKNRFEIIRR